eukprot:TRINITY_DN4023_c0_g1_i2.p1 TRINITY_DN4023_c0_g1~~TRINITY_DN4023_c0_g1_i2.p1  ORF type:complete len:1019 (+),score=217.97 TRINITY_DN4023_c0_g1_i2:30-3086(+)
MSMSMSYGSLGAVVILCDLIFRVLLGFSLDSLVFVGALSTGFAIGIGFIIGAVFHLLSLSPQEYDQYLSHKQSQPKHLNFNQETFETKRENYDELWYVPELKGRVKVLKDPTTFARVRLWYEGSLKENHFIMRSEATQGAAIKEGKFALDGCSISVVKMKDRDKEKEKEKVVKGKVKGPKQPYPWKHKNYIEILHNQRFLLGDSKCIYLFLQNRYELEQWYYGLCRAAKFSEFKSLGTKNIFQPKVDQVNWLYALTHRIFFHYHNDPGFLHKVTTLIKEKISSVKKPSLIKSVTLEDIKFFPSFPCFDKIEVLQITPEGGIKIASDIVYEGCFKLKLDLVAEVDLWKIGRRIFPLSLTVRVNKIQGKLVIVMTAPRSNRIWLAFDNAPKVDLTVRTKFLSNDIPILPLTNIIKELILAEINEIFVLPAMDDIQYPKFGKNKDGFEINWRNAEPEPVNIKQTSQNAPKEVKSKNVETEKPTLQPKQIPLIPSLPPRSDTQKTPRSAEFPITPRSGENNPPPKLPEFHPTSPRNHPSHEKDQSNTRETQNDNHVIETDKEKLEVQNKSSPTTEDQIMQNNVVDTIFSKDVKSEIEEPKVEIVNATVTQTIQIEEAPSQLFNESPTRDDTSDSSVVADQSHNIYSNSEIDNVQTSVQEELITNIKAVIEDPVLELELQIEKKLSDDLLLSPQIPIDAESAEENLIFGNPLEQPTSKLNHHQSPFAENREQKPHSPVYETETTKAKIIDLDTDEDLIFSSTSSRSNPPSRKDSQSNGNTNTTDTPPTQNIRKDSNSTDTKPNTTTRKDSQTYGNTTSTDPRRDSYSQSNPPSRKDSNSTDTKPNTTTRKDSQTYGNTTSTDPRRDSYSQSNPPSRKDSNSTDTRPNATTRKDSHGFGNDQSILHSKIEEIFEEEKKVAPKEDGLGKFEFVDPVKVSPKKEDILAKFDFDEFSGEEESTSNQSSVENFNDITATSKVPKIFLGNTTATSNTQPTKKRDIAFAPLKKMKSKLTEKKNDLKKKFG